MGWGGGEKVGLEIHVPDGGCGREVSLGLLLIWSNSSWDMTLRPVHDVSPPCVEGASARSLMRPRLGSPSVSKRSSQAQPCAGIYKDVTMASSATSGVRGGAQALSFRPGST